MMSTSIIMYVEIFANNQINLMNVYYSYYMKNKTIFFTKKSKICVRFPFASCKSKFGTFKYTRNKKATMCIKKHAYFHKKNISACAQKRARLFSQQPTRPDGDNDRKIEFNKWLPRMHKINKNELVQSLR